MKKNLFFIFILILFTLTNIFSSGSKETKNQKNNLIIYAYDSFTADWGAGPVLVDLFQKKTGIKTELISCGDAVQVLTRAILEKKNPQASILLGIDNNLIDRARKENILEPYKSSLADRRISTDLILAHDWLVTPYDWSYFTIIFDTDSNLKVPQNLEDLCLPIYEKKLILMDPRMSTPGLGFLAWTMAVYKDGWISYWERLKPSILTLAPGWDTGYGLFTAGEAPLVISYTTSPAYHLEYENTERYKALIFESGHVSQIEGLGLVKNAPNPHAAKAFIDFMLSDEAQSILPLTQWMYPVSQTVSLPQSFIAAPQAEKHLFVDPKKLLDAVETVLTILAQ